MAGVKPPMPIFGRSTARQGIAQQCTKGIVVCPEPLCGEVLYLLYVFDDVLVEPFVPDCAVVSLDVGVLLRFSGLDVLDGDTLLLSPFHELTTDIFRAIVHTNSARFSAPFDDTFQAPDDPFGWQGKVDLDAQSFAVEVVKHVQQSERSSIAKTICHEIHRPSLIWFLRHRQGIRFVPFQSLFQLDLLPGSGLLANHERAQVQFQFAVDAVNAFVVPRMALHVA